MARAVLVELVRQQPTLGVVDWEEKEALVVLRMLQLVVAVLV
jgi:hypothetical protein